MLAGANSSTLCNSTSLCSPTCTLGVTGGKRGSRKGAPQKELHEDALSVVTALLGREAARHPVPWENPWNRADGGHPRSRKPPPGHLQLPGSSALPFSLPCLKEGLWCRPAGPLPQRRLTADLSSRVLWDHGVGGELGVQDAAVRVGVHGQRVQQLPVLQHPRVQRGAGLRDQLGDVV